MSNTVFIVFAFPLLAAVLAGSASHVCVPPMPESSSSKLVAYSGSPSGTQPAHQPPGLPEGPSWGRGNFQPSAANSVFATADGCSLCHSSSPRAAALWSATGEDVSPYATWRGSMMAHSAKDPYWRAQVAKETARQPELAPAIEALCVRCHTPMGHHTHKLAGLAPLRVAAAAADPLFGDGVSCTVCHQIQPTGLGTEDRFNGRIEIKPGRTIFGPYSDPGGQPMIMHSAFTPTHGEHIRSSALCGSCHTLRTEHTGTQFPEQSPYLEWRNSVFNDEIPSKGPEAKACRECHMPEVGPMRVARNPAGLDFNLKTREEVRAHTFVGGNAFMLDLMAANAVKLGISTPREQLERNARATRAQLSHATATIAIENVRREAGAGGETVVFEVVVTNMTGHKFPSGYPSRRAWIDAEVRDGRTTVFESGEADERGRIKGFSSVEAELGEPHRDVITDASQVAIYEMVAADMAGKPTTYLAEMSRRVKDTRLLPRGYSMTGPHAADTAPVGVDGDNNFVGGSDRVTYRVTLPAGSTGKRLTLVARLLYQTIPPAWVEPLRSVKAAEASSFVEMYDAAKATPETVAVTVAFSE